MKTRTMIFSLSVMLLGLMIVGMSTNNFVAFAGTEVGVGVESETEIKVGEETSVESSSKTEAEVSAESRLESSSESEHDSESESHTTMESESSAQMSIKSSYPKMSANSDNSFVIQSRNNLYAPGQSVHVEGSLWATLMAKIGSANTAQIQIFDSKGMVVSEQTVDVASD